MFQSTFLRGFQLSPVLHAAALVLSPVCCSIMAWSLKYDTRHHYFLTQGEAEVNSWWTEHVHNLFRKPHLVSHPTTQPAQ